MVLLKQCVSNTLFLAGTECMSALTASPLFGVLKSGMFSMVYPNGSLTLSAISLKAAEMSCKEDKCYCPVERTYQIPALNKSRVCVRMHGGGGAHACTCALF